MGDMRRGAAASSEHAHVPSPPSSPAWRVGHSSTDCNDFASYRETNHVSPNILNHDPYDFISTTYKKYIFSFDYFPDLGGKVCFIH